MIKKLLLSLVLFNVIFLNTISHADTLADIRNELNFLNLEAFHLNIPIIHNCKPFMENGLYYSDNDETCEYNKAVEYLYKISNNNCIIYF